MSKLEKTSDINIERLATLESLAAEFEQRLLAVMHPEGSGYQNGEVPCADQEGGEGDAGVLAAGAAPHDASGREPVPVRAAA